VTLRRFLARRRFYLLLPGIVLGRLRAGRRNGVFVSLMGGVGDLVNAFPALEALSARSPVDLGTGGGPYRALAAVNPHLQTVHAPFVYKPIRRRHRRTIERVLSSVYERVILLDESDSAWRTRGRHISAVYAARCGVPAPDRGRLYLPEASRRAAGRYLERIGVKEFVYVVQSVRRRRPFRSWPLAHYQALVALLRERSSLPILVDTVGSDETTVPEACVRLAPLDILTAAAVIERARLYIGPDTGPTHIAAALGVPTVAIHLGYAPEVCGALGDNVALVRQRRPLDDPTLTSPDEVLDAVERLAARCHSEEARG
jgi:ADP-heptose:LPS heptosyltransferase